MAGSPAKRLAECLKCKIAAADVELDYPLDIWRLRDPPEKVFEASVSKDARACSPLLCSGFPSNPSLGDGLVDAALAVGVVLNIALDRASALQLFEIVGRRSADRRSF
jgi:hypothetical protein